MSAPYENRGSSSRRRGVVTHWVPLVLTLTIATAGVAAWAWSQRTRDDDYEDDEDEYGGRPSGVPQQQQQQQQQQQPPYAPQQGGGGGPPPPGAQANVDYEYGDYGENPPYGASGARSAAGVSAVSGAPSAASWGARMSGALGRASSPQQWVGNASKAVTAGITAASAAVGGALASIREGDRDAYADHETWSEEIDARRRRPAAPPSPAPAASAAAPAAAAASSVAGRKRKTVAIVVSAEHYVDGSDEEGFHEHASILSFIPRQTDLSKTRIFVLIYAPSLKEGQTLEPPEAPGLQTANSLSSSFSNIAAEGAAAGAGSPKQEATAPPTAANVSYNALHTQARALVEKDTEIIPFTTPNGYAHVLHLLEPDVVYVQESLTGENGAIVSQMQNWMRNDIIVVVGAESGHGGLADSESEAEKPSEGAAAAALKWWQREERVGRGRGVVVVDGMRVNDDWIRRVQGKE